jgi:hypothetical protein
LARYGSSIGLPVETEREPPATETLVAADRLPRPGRDITLAAPIRTRTSSRGSITRFIDGRVSS